MDLASKILSRWCAHWERCKRRTTTPPWALGLRMRAAHEADIEQAVIERRIVRTWPLRGTLHWVAAEDVHWMLALLAPRILQRSAARLLRDFAIDRALIKRAGRILRAALGGGHA